MLRPAILLLFAALATTAPPAGASPWRADAAVDGAPSPWPGSHLRVGWSRAVDAAEADVTGAGPGTAAAPSVRVRLPGGRGNLGVRGTAPAGAPAPFHLRDRASHPANAPPKRA